ncbi:hypothetical protein N8811_03190 [Planktomarina temperata]|jgi:hypothetical protein|nr:hypothetical protein [Hellea sp.]MDA7449479.1 hypothetical protein [Planktomarina temperata]
MKNVILISLLLIITNAITYWLSDKIKLIFLKNEVPIIAEIQLETNCELMNESFVIMDLLTNKSVTFNMSKAYLRTVEGNPLQVQMNPNFSDVTSDFEIHKAAKKMKIDLDCNISNRLKNTLDSLRNTFKN